MASYRPSNLQNPSKRQSINKNNNKIDKKNEGISKQTKKNIITGTILLFLAFFGTYGAFALLKVSLHTDYPIVVVTSGSMEPTIYRGDLLIVKGVAPEDIKSGTIENKQGDIILYDSHGVWSNPIPDPIVHRVVGKYYDNETQKWYFITKGDNNPDTDPPDFTGSIEIPVPEDKVLGVVIKIIPKVGLIKIYLEDYGMTIPLIIILGILLVISIVYDITHPEEDEENKKKMKELENLTEREKIKKFANKKFMNENEEIDENVDDKINNRKNLLI